MPRYQAFVLLRIAFTVAPIAFGARQVRQRPRRLAEYLAPWINDIAARQRAAGMYVVGVIEIVAGVAVALKPRYGAYVVAGWLAGIIVNLLTLLRLLRHRAARLRPDARRAHAGPPGLRLRRPAAVQPPRLSSSSVSLAIAKPQPSAGLTFGGTATSSGLVTTSSSTGPGVRRAPRATASSSSSGSLDPRRRAGRSRAATAARSGLSQHGAELRQAALLLLELDHAEPAVVEDDELDRQVVGDGGDAGRRAASSGRRRRRTRRPGASRSSACAPSACGIALAIEPRL